MAHQKVHLKRTRRKKLHTALVTFGVIGVCVGATAVYLALLVRTLPSPEQFAARHVSETTKLYDRTGTVLLYEVHGDEKRTVVPFDKIPETVKKATLAAEDAEFYTQPAFNWRGILRALITDIQEGRVAQGGSTITQQLVKNTLLSSEKTITRKVKEILLAIELESKYTKDEIFSFYLNQMPYGSNAYGIETASQLYFGKQVANLTTGESAVLAAILQAPSYYSPWSGNKTALMERERYVLNRMRELGSISDEQLKKALAENVTFSPQNVGSIRAPHFSLMVREYLIGKYGERAVLEGGLKVITTLDMKLQEYAETSVREGAERNESLYKGTNAALVAQDPKTGQVLAFVGSKDYFDDSIDGKFNMPVQGIRQPGSSLKPFVYMTAFEKGYSPKTVLFDVKTEFDTRGNAETSYQPENFDGVFRGPIRMEEALAQSLNIPAVKTLYLVGLDSAVSTLRDFGISTLTDPSRYGLSLTLGGGEVKLGELVNAYATLADDGIFHNQSFILEVIDSNGTILESYKDKSRRVVDAQYPRMVSKILSSSDLRGPIFHSSLSLTVFPGYDVALKTGTTQDYRDAWTLGYTPNLAVGVWAGNSNNKPMQQNGSSILAAVPIWSSFLKQALPLTPPDQFEEPEATEAPNKPMLNGEWVSSQVVNGTRYQQIHSVLFYVDRKNPMGPAPINPQEDPEFYNWESGVADWVKKTFPYGVNVNTPIPLH